MTWVWVTAVAVSVALVMGAATGPILRRLPEPTDDPDFADKRPYAQLATRGFSATVAVTSAVAGGIAMALTPMPAWLAWISLAGPGALAAAVDARTTWMPKVLLHAVGAIAIAGIAVWAFVTMDPSIAIRGLVGAVSVGGFFFLFWRVTHGIGFSDVRLMASVGAVSAATAMETAMAAVFAGALLGACWGVIRPLLGRRGAFAYGPALWAGAFVGLAVMQAPHLLG